jgi:hypothetical protein
MESTLQQAMGWTAKRSQSESQWGQDSSPLHIVETGTWTYLAI